ncbi:diadenylate cyclase [Phycisphaeraceae bacterium D3-23]
MSDVVVVDRFMLVLAEVLDAVGKPYYQGLLAKLGDRVVAEVAETSRVKAELISECLRVLESWASQTYEGHRIAYAIGIDGAYGAGKTSLAKFSDLADEDFAKVLSNGIDTMVAINADGKVFFYGACGQGVSRPFAPIRVGPLAKWTSETSRVCLVLNRLGEIIVLKNGAMNFAKRSGNWHHFTHEECISQMGKVGSRDLRQAVYETSIDVSFARTGACICLMKSSKRGSLKSYVVANDLIESSSTEKSIVLKHCVGRNFEQLDRRLRLEIASMDGATIIDHNGRIVAAGAIVTVPGGSSGGGRRAASVALSRLGLAIKVSADGGITAFTDRGSVSNPEVAFEICK